MNLLSIENLTKTYGERILFDNVTFGIDEGDKIGLIGVNGTGKSTFLKIIAGVEPADSGKVVTGSSVQVQYLPQNPEFDEDATVLEQVFHGYTPLMQTLKQYEQVLSQSQKQPHDLVLQKRLIALTQEMDTLNAWQLESEAKNILSRLGIDDFAAQVKNLSGGQKKRIALASALIQPSDLLILDEPTNHIDNTTVAWLEQYLAKRKGALLMITHDRYFLDRVANRMFELDKGQIYNYMGNYSRFLELKAEREELLEASERKRQNLLRNELAWIRRGAQARSTKQKARIERFEELSAVKFESGDEKMEISVGSSRLGRTIIELKNISEAFDGTAFIKEFSYIVLKNDRVGIVGPNGSGKSTLLNIIAGRLAPDSGTVETGQTVKLGYFSQENTEMDETVRVIDYIKEEAHFLTTADGTVITASQMLERFLFSSKLQWLPIGKLSGGEKRRLYLLKVLMGAPNVLLLDEPTNDLDIQTLTILEDYLENFAGAVIIVSHDRYFLDKLVDKIFAFEGGGSIRQYNGGYSQYEETKQLETACSEDKEKNAPKPAGGGKAKECQRKLSFNEQREYNEIEGVIASIEGELAAVKAQLEVSGTNYTLLEELLERQTELNGKLEEKLERWAYLSEIAEEMKI